MKLSTIAILLAAAAALTPASAASARIENAKNSCIVGEQADGYLGFVPGASADAELRREVRDINQQRKAVYVDIAERSGVTVEDAAARTASKLIGQATAGQCVRDAKGDWVHL
ncbi:MAG: YdbL family protein [Parvularculaceae bacterium]